MSELNNGQLLKEIHKLITTLDERTKNIKEQLDNVTPIFQPNGICDKSRRLVDTLDSRSKNNAKLTYLILGAIITLAVFVIRMSLVKG